MTKTEKVEETAEKIGNAFASLIPQLFFDVIARIIPGCVILTLLLVTASAHWNSLASWYALHPEFIDDNLVFVVILAITSIYVVAVVFYGVWACFMHIVYTSCSWLDAVISAASKKGTPLKFIGAILLKVRELFYGTFVEVVEACPEFSFRHDYIKLNAPIAGSRITKLKAEIHMSGALAAAFGISCGLSYYSALDSWLVKLFLLATIGCIFANRHFTKRLHRSVNSYSVLLNFPTDKYAYPDYRIHLRSFLNQCGAKPRDPNTG